MYYLLFDIATDIFLNSPDFEDLRKYRLTNDEWNALVITYEILLVSLELSSQVLWALFTAHLLVPFAFQQKLSAHKTPTLCDAIPSFEAMISIWTEKQENASLTESDIIQEGLNKLTVYQDQANHILAYAIAMNKPVCMIDQSPSMQLIDLEVLNSSLKLQHYKENKQKRYGWAKGLLCETVSQSVLFVTSIQCY